MFVSGYEEVSSSVEGVVVSDRRPGVAGHKVLTEGLLANGLD